MATQAEPVKTIPRQQQSLLAAGAAVGLSLLLLDAAVETFISGSTVRWWVAGLVGVAASTVAYFFHSRPHISRDINWNVRATIVGFLLLVLITITAWLPGGLMEGIRLLGQPTSRVYSLVTLGAITVASIALESFAMRMPWLRWTIRFFAVYGVAGFLLGMLSATPYSSLFHGGSFWTRMPASLQGTTAGVLIIAGGTVYSLAAKIRSGTGRAMLSGSSQPLAFGMVLLLALAAIRTPSAIPRYELTFGNVGAHLGPVMFAKGNSHNRPVIWTDRFKQGVQNIYVTFNVANLKPDDAVTAVWSKGATELSQERNKVSELVARSGKANRVWFAHEFGLDGALAGGYFVEISVNDRPVAEASFAVDPAR